MIFCVKGIDEKLELFDEAVVYAFSSLKYTVKERW
jgi:hypothetical protein